MTTLLVIAILAFGLSMWFDFLAARSLQREIELTEKNQADIFQEYQETKGLFLDLDQEEYDITPFTSLEDK